MLLRLVGLCCEVGLPWNLFPLRRTSLVVPFLVLCSTAVGFGSYLRSAMGVDLSSYRQSIGLWAAVVASASPLREQKTSFQRSRSCLIVCFYLFLLLRAAASPAAGDVQRNPGPSFDSNSHSNSTASSGSNRHSRDQDGCKGHGA